MAATNNCLAQRSTIRTGLNVTKSDQRGATFLGLDGKTPFAGQCCWSAPKGAGPAPRATPHSSAQKRSDTLLSGDVASAGKSSPAFGRAKPPGKTGNAN